MQTFVFKGHSEQWCLRLVWLDIDDRCLEGLNAPVSVESQVFSQKYPPMTVRSAVSVRLPGTPAGTLWTPTSAPIAASADVSPGGFVS